MNAQAPKPVVVATDLSRASDAAVAGAADLAAYGGAPLRLVHAFEALFPSFPEGAEVVSPLSHTERLAEVRRALAAQQDRATPLGRPGVDACVRVGAPHRAIVDECEDSGAELLVLGPHREGLPLDRFLSTTLDLVLRTAEVPILVVPGTLSLPLRRILVAIDLSDPAPAALEVALDWAARFGAPPEPGSLSGVEVRILHVLPPPGVPEGFAPVRASIGPGLSPGLQAVAERSPGARGVDLREEVFWGRRAQAEIARAAEEQPADLLVLATHGRGRAGRQILGSVASALARRPALPTLLLPPSLWRRPRSAARAREAWRKGA